MASENVTLIRLGAVQKMTALSRSSLYDMMSRGAFPKPVRIGARAVAWRHSDIIAWIESRPAAGGQLQ